MIRLTLLLTCLALCAPVFAQDTPRVSVEIQDTQTVVGQPLIVRIRVLVPTFSPKPPEFPSLEAPGLIVRLPERASGPISDSVDGETWSGVQRAYRVYPLQEGTFEIPSQTVRVTYAEPGGITPITVEIDTDPIRFQALVPRGAEALTPLIVASDFTLSQTLEVSGVIEIGDAIVRTVTAEITGTTPILIPQLIAPLESTSLRTYPKEPQVSETETRGDLSGTKTESVTYLAAVAGDVTLPVVEFSWFNLTTNQVETARVDGATVSISGEVAAAEGAETDWTRILSIVAAIGVGLWLLSKLWPKLKAAALAIQARWKASEVYAALQVRKAISRGDLSETYETLETWLKHFPEAAPSALEPALVDVGAMSYDSGGAARSAHSWQKLAAAFKAFRQDCIRRRRGNRARDELPPLNPVG